METQYGVKVQLTGIDEVDVGVSSEHFVTEMAECKFCDFSDDDDHDGHCLKAFGLCCIIEESSEVTGKGPTSDF